MNGNWGITSVLPVQWLYIAITRNDASSQALANGPLVNDTVTGRATARKGL